MFSLLSTTRSHHHHVQLDRSVQADLRWWASFLRHWNGQGFFPQPLAPLSHVYTSASGSFGCGGIALPHHWFKVNGRHSIDISVKELFPIVVAAAIWGKGWRQTRVCFHTDNMAVVAMLQNKSARDPIVRPLFVFLLLTVSLPNTCRVC